MPGSLDKILTTFPNPRILYSMLPAIDPRVRQVLGAHGGLARAGQLLAAGIHPRTLYAARDAGQLQQVSRGVYRLADAEIPDYFDLRVVAARAPEAVVCLISALAFHEITEQIPHEVYIAIPRDAAPPRIDWPPVRVFRFSDAAFRLGIERHELDGVTLRVYSPTKSIVDAFRLRHLTGNDVAIDALKQGLYTRKARPGALDEMASKLRCRAVLSPYIQALAS